MKKSFFLLLSLLISVSLTSANRLNHIEYLADESVLHFYDAIDSLNVFLSQTQSTKDIIKARALRQYCYCNISHNDYCADSLRLFLTQLPKRDRWRKTFLEALGEADDIDKEKPDNQPIPAKQERRKPNIGKTEKDTLLYYAFRNHYSLKQKAVFYEKALNLATHSYEKLIINAELGNLYQLLGDQREAICLANAANLALQYIYYDPVDKADFLHFIIDYGVASLEYKSYNDAQTVISSVDSLLYRYWGINDSNVASYLYRIIDGDLSMYKDVNLYHPLVRYLLFKQRFALHTGNFDKADEYENDFRQVADMLNTDIRTFIGYQIKRYSILEHLSIGELSRRTWQRTMTPDEIDKEMVMSGYKNVEYYDFNKVLKGLINQDSRAITDAFGQMFGDYKNFYINQLVSYNELGIWNNTLSSAQRQELHILFEKQREMLMNYVYFFDYPQLNALAYDYTLFYKQLLLETDRKLYSGDTLEKKELAARANILKRQLYKSSDLFERDSLQTLIASAERELSLLTKFDTANFFVSYSQVREALPDSSNAVEFVCFKNIFLPENLGSDYHLALLLTHSDSMPRLCRLDNNKRVLAPADSLIDSTAINHFYKSKDLYSKIWLWIEGYFDKTAETIYYSTDGSLNTYALTCVEGFLPFLLFNIRNYCRLSSTKQILDIKKQFIPHSACVYGDLTYQLSEQTMKNNAFADTRDLRSVASPLTYSKEEINSISDLLQKNDVEYKIFSKTSGIEDAFLALSNHSVDIIHLSTHGFYLSAEQAEHAPYLPSSHLPIVQSDPMERCGLLFSGAGRVIEGKTIPKGVEDGILTAAEISTLDLSNTRLVVLSACETALGDITTEGVWGLGRAFKQAGVQTIVMSLWKVDDEAVALLMKFFYEELFASKDFNPHKALEVAQLRMKYDTKYSDPYYWAAFIVID